VERVSDSMRILSDAELEAPLEAEVIDDAGPTPGVAIPGYVLHAEISTGGQATVYRATQETTGKRVAVKVLPGGPFVSAKNRARFDREVQALAALDHPHIVGIVDRGRTADGSFFLVMDYVDGVSLDTHVFGLRHRRGGVRAICELFIKIARAVEEAHRAGIVHRDLKPSNIRIDRAGEPRVLDFGLARFGDVSSIDAEHDALKLTMTGQVVGSLPWASPEQARGQSARLDGRSDVYSLGVMLYESVSGQYPYEVFGPIDEVIANITAMAPRPLALPHGAVSEKIEAGKLEAVIVTASQKDPGRRYATAGELAHDLARLLAGELTVAAPIRRRRAWQWALALLPMLLAGGVLAWQYQRWYPTITPVVLPAREHEIGLRFVRIPQGMARIGAEKTEPGWQQDEQPFVITIPRPFYISTTEVTRAQFRQIMPESALVDAVLLDSAPATGVTWQEAVEFCRRLSARDGRTYRLPTESEWEYAARAGSNAMVAGTRRIDQMAWHAGNAGGTLRAVGGKLPNHWGLYDMQGNAAEWCSDHYYRTHEIRERGLDQNVLDYVYIVRGGSVVEPPETHRLARRDHRSGSSRDPHTGFRVVMEVTD
jgi:formylglycine-generating enzyme required for sulfatase activity